MRFIRIAVALALVVAGCAPTAQSPTQPAAGYVPTDSVKLRIGTATTPPTALPESTLWLARDLGFYQKEGLDVEIIEATAKPSVIAAMRSGEVDVGSINSEDVIRLSASKDLEMRMINSSNGRNFFMIVGKDSIGSLKQVNG